MLRAHRLASRLRAALPASLVHGLCVALVACAGEVAPQGEPAATPARPTASATKPPDGPPVTAHDAEARLRELSARFLASYLALAPVEATRLGEHRYDAAWPDVSAEGDEAFRRFARGLQAELAAIEVDRLGLQARVDHAMLTSRLAYWLFALDELRPGEVDPLFYTTLIGDGLDPLTTRSFASAEVRMKSLQGRLEGIARIVEVAKRRLGRPARIVTETAIQQNRGLVELCKTGLARNLAEVPAQRAALESAASKAAAALEDFQRFLERDLLPRSDRDFRLGRALFDKKLRFELDDPELDLDALATAARSTLVAMQGAMVDTAVELWPTLGKGPVPPHERADEQKAIVRQAVAARGADHPTNATIVAESKKLLADATAFVKAQDIVRVPDDPVDVIEMPEYRRGVAIAYCDSSGPLEKKQETFFAISPTPSDWTKARADSFYREYNRSMLAELTIHEAMPGHYLQIMHANRFESPVRAVLASGAFVEGWAVYAEGVMAQHGFGGPRVKLMRQKMVLRLAANAVLDHDIHAGSMDEKAALALMVDEAFQEEGEAVGKWRRARLTSAQLSTYFYGYEQMAKLRSSAEQAPGFRERAYHDELLASGAPSLRWARALMEAHRAAPPPRR